MDTYNGTVYLSGVVNDEPERRQYAEIAALDDHKVVNNLQTRSEVAARRAAAAALQSAPAAAPTTASRHSMTGEVVAVDHETGKLTLKTVRGTLDFHFPPSALANVRAGDRVTVDLGLRP